MPRRVSLPYKARVDGRPRRSVTCVNVRFEDKAVFDHLVSWWSLKRGADLRQWDAFSRLLSLALEHPDAQVPAELRARLRAIS